LLGDTEHRLHAFPFAAAAAYSPPPPPCVKFKFNDASCNVFSEAAIKAFAATAADSLFFTD